MSRRIYARSVKLFWDRFQFLRSFMLRPLSRSENFGLQYICSIVTWSIKSHLFKSISKTWCSVKIKSTWKFTKEKSIWILSKCHSQEYLLSPLVYSEVFLSHLENDFLIFSQYLFSLPKVTRLSWSGLGKPQKTSKCASKKLKSPCHFDPTLKYFSNKLSKMFPINLTGRTNSSEREWKKCGTQR